MPNKPLDLIPLTSLKGVGPSLEKKFIRLGIHNLQDLLFHLPVRYEDRTKLNTISSVKLGDHAQICGEIVSSNILYGRRRSLQCLLQDSTGLIFIRFFHFNATQKESLIPGKKIFCYGEVRRGSKGFEIYHPEYKEIQNLDSILMESTLTPIYPTTEGIQQNRLRGLIKQGLEMLHESDGITDLIPIEISKRYELCNLTEAVKVLHNPPTDLELNMLDYGLNPGQKRLAFEELLAHRLCMRKSRIDVAQDSAAACKVNKELSSKFLKQLPFRLTNSQKYVLKEITEDLVKPTPMLRLLQGDVGSGKTVVAALASLQAISNGFQVALMAPTEILAEQHFQNFSQWYSPIELTVGWLSGKVKGSARQKILKDLKSGTCQLLIGTHALFQQEVNYRKLGLIIIDEQHRFGVHQRLYLRNKAAFANLHPHQLIMTATPIPRSLAMSAYADLDTSVIRELPPGRFPINTVIMSNQKRGEVIERIRAACIGGNQVYWVCTLIEESETLECQAAEATAQNLVKQLPDIKIGLIHGRMRSEEKNKIMADFKKGTIQLLVATTVIEVGVDVPNASLMIVENAERLGLAQLHQLRGRIGRGNNKSHCILLYQAPLSRNSKLRLSVLRDSSDGFHIAEKDLELRGPGQVLGTKQAGLMAFKVADLRRDAQLLDDVKVSSEIIFQNHLEHIDPLIQRWLSHKEEYVNV